MFRTPDMLRALRQRNYRLWAAADFLSVGGTWMQVLGVNWLLLSISGSATSLGFGLFLQSLPTLLLAFAGGSLADRLPARPLVLTGQALHGLLALALAVIAFSDVQSVWPIYAVALLGGMVSALDGPALGRFGAEVVGPEDLSNGLALGSVISSGGRILGMALAGALIPLTGTGTLFLLNALSFGVVIATVLCMRAGEMHPLPRAEAAQAGVAAGLRYISRTRWLLVLLGMAFVLGALGRNYQVTMAAMSEGPLNAGAAGYGVLSVVFAVGAVLGGLYAASRPRLTFRILFAAALLTSVGQALSGIVPGLLGFAVMLLPIAAAAVVLDTTVSTRAQLDTDPAMRGRVLAAQTMVGAASGAVGGPVLGMLCDALGPRQALILAGVVTTVAACAAAALLTRSLGRTSPVAAAIGALRDAQGIRGLRGLRGLRRPSPAGPVRRPGVSRSVRPGDASRLSRASARAAARRTRA
ncbi:MFS transporter [Planobispora rosea]|uniref:MFS transporter n=1 Tax=Planobispora rosea TaxID=35762 RepID=A0A8J3S836_PLARO|nr:MFS transporter [Planobispora rosea]GGS86352.1 MFS transporter [Planobispora rosea]GIH89063.1 MFS transporter [Planobispora rosea]